MNNFAGIKEIISTNLNHAHIMIFIPYIKETIPKYLK